MYTTDHIFTVIPIKHLVNQDGEPTMPHKLTTRTKLQVSNLRVLLCTCVVQKSTAHVDTKALNMSHQPQKGFNGISVGITQHQKWYLICIPSTQKIFFSHDVVFNETFSSALAYKTHPHSEALAIQPSVSYIPHATSSDEQTSKIVTFAQF